jgi:predicted permease
VADSLLQDIRYAFRTLRRAPLFVVTVAATIGLGLGLLGSAFTLFNAYVLRPVDLPDPYSLYALSWDTDRAPRQRFRLADYEALQPAAQRFVEVAAVLDVMAMEREVTTRGVLVTGNYFDLMGARPAVGRLLRPDDAAARGGRAVVVLSNEIWRGRYGSNPTIVGQLIQLGSRGFEVVGVAAPHSGLSGQEGMHFWAPITMAGAFPASDPWTRPDTRLTVVGRLRPGVAAGSLRAWFDVWLRQRFPPPSDAAPVAVRVDSLATRLRLDGQLLTMFMLIMAAFGLVLLVACANVTNLMLARALARQPEITVRLALGASRWRVARQLIVESLLLAVPAAGMGLALIVVAARAFPAAILATFPAGILSVEALQTMLIPLDPDLRVMAFLAAAAIASAVIITLAPTGRLAALRLSQAARGDVSTDVRGSRLRSGLVAMQIGACALFLVGAVTLIDESSRLANQPRNLDFDRVSMVIIDPAVRAKVVSRLAADPAVAYVAVASKPPLLSGALPTTRMTASATNVALNAGYTIVSPDYFPLFDIRIVRGRTFSRAESVAGDGVVLVSEATAAALWPGLDPIGQTLDVAAPSEGRAERRLSAGRVRVIGVTEDVATGSITQGLLDTSCVYFPTETEAPGQLSLLARARADSADGVSGALAAITREVAPDGAFQAIAMRSALGGAAWIFRAFSVAASVLGLVGLLFAYSGTHAVVSFLVAQRTREFGVRMALGATAWHIVRGMLVEMSRTASIGVAVGCLIAAGVMRLFSSSNAILPGFGVRPFLVGATIVIVAAAVAALAPLRTAARIDPARALRTD